MTETQRTITRWAQETFGAPSSLERVAARANEEMAELLRVMTAGGNPTDIVTEAADVMIVPYRLADLMGHDLHIAIDAKMAINRKRTWIRDHDGTGRHVRDKSDA